MKRIMVDLSATLIHHGHIKLLKRASLEGDVIVALTSDDEIFKNKGYYPELTFAQRAEILSAVIYVKEIVSSNWLIDEDFLDEHKIDFLAHGSDNSNPISEERLMLFPRTKGISSTRLRANVLKALSDKLLRQS
jgi:cytidyltransferase-like protein